MAIDVTLSGPTTGVCGDFLSFAITLASPAPVPVTWTVTSSEPSDTVSLVPPMMPAGTKDWGFFFLAATCGPRTITLGSDADPTVLRLVVDHVTFTALCTCPSDTGDADQSATFGLVAKNCGSHTLQFSLTPTSVAERDLYGDSPVSAIISE